ncbi:MAG: DUF2157 domain-containing protein [Alphaproteobacteria bacterium]|nr:DUF2157 domain-containing protein [Alphaproteobacteria bacterium]
MFKAKQLDKLVKAGIITAEQQKQILSFDNSSGGFVMRALNLLGIFTIGVGVISLVASNWEYLGDNLKLIVMFALLFGAAGMAVSNKLKGQDNRAEKWLVALFLFVGAVIGLVIQIYQLSGNIMHLPFALWWAATLPLLFAAKKKYVAWFWMPLFLVWCAMYAGGGFWLEICLGVYAALYAGGSFLSKYKPDFVAGEVLRRDACFAFYLVLAGYILFYDLWHLTISALILLLTSGVYHYFKDYGKVRLNIKFAGLWVFSLYIYLGDKIGLFSTGIGLIISGVVLIALVKGVVKWAKLIKKEEKKNA